ncbi:MAG: hypothetical protein AAF242_04010 [Bacteroidota bacterium]
MKIEQINVFSLKEASLLSAIRCADFSEAASVCLDNQGHISGKEIKIEGDLEGQFKLVWNKVTQQIRSSRNDLEDAVEGGAYCLAMLVIEKLTKLKVSKQSQKRTGFDYWLGEGNDGGVQGLARLEVSGILKGTKGQINQRLKEKMQQTQKSDNLNIPAYIVIVEFSQPILKIKKR